MHHSLATVLASVLFLSLSRSLSFVSSHSVSRSLFNSLSHSLTHTLTLSLALCFACRVGSPEDNMKIGREAGEEIRAEAGEKFFEELIAYVANIEGANTKPTKVA